MVKKIEVGSVCKQRLPINVNESLRRFIITKLYGDKLECYDTLEPDYTYRNIKERDLVVTEK